MREYINKHAYLRKLQASKCTIVHLNLLFVVNITERTTPTARGVCAGGTLVTAERFINVFPARPEN